MVLSAALAILVGLPMAIGGSVTPSGETIHLVLQDGEAVVWRLQVLPGTTLRMAASTAQCYDSTQNILGRTAFAIQDRRPTPHIVELRYAGGLNDAISANVAGHRVAIPLPPAWEWCEEHGGPFGVQSLGPLNDSLTWVFVARAKQTFVNLTPTYTGGVVSEDLWVGPGVLVSPTEADTGIHVSTPLAQLGRGAGKHIEVTRDVVGYMQPRLAFGTEPTGYECLKDGESSCSWHYPSSIVTFSSKGAHGWDFRLNETTRAQGDWFFLALVELPGDDYIIE